MWLYLTSSVCCTHMYTEFYRQSCSDYLLSCSLVLSSLFVVINTAQRWSDRKSSPFWRVSLRALPLFGIKVNCKCIIHGWPPRINPSQSKSFLSMIFCKPHWPSTTSYLASMETAEPGQHEAWWFSRRVERERPLLTPSSLQFTPCGDEEEVTTIACLWFPPQRGFELKRQPVRVNRNPARSPVSTHSRLSSHRQNLDLVFPERVWGLQL